jgi:predicted permease
MASQWLCLLQLLLLMLSSASHARDIISPGQPLRGNDTLVSAGSGSFVLGFFTPPGSNNTYVGVWYARVSVRTVVWVANRADPVPGPVEDNAGATLSVSADGTLAVADANSTVVWSVSPAPGAGAGQYTSRIRDDGNLVVSDASGRVSWQGFDHPTDTLLPGMRVGMDFVTGANMTLTAWTSPSDPSPGPVMAAMDTSGDPEVFIWNGGEKVWRSGPWDGLQFTGVPDTVTYTGFSFRFVNTPREVSYSFQVPNSSFLSRLALNSTGAAGGLLQRWTWVWAAGAWNMYWYAPKDQCDAVNRLVAYFAVPFFAFDFAARMDPYALNYRVLAADALSKLAVVLALAAWAAVSTRCCTRRGDGGKGGGDLASSWCITGFSLATLNNTLVVGVPLLDAMYGGWARDLVVQISVVQIIVYFPLLLLAFEVRRACGGGVATKPDTAAPPASDNDVEGGGVERRSQQREPVWPLVRAVWLKVARNPNVYAGVLGVTWSCVTNRYYSSIFFC